jgi:DNA-directed RNA polymerase specialized sigma24 family protein
MGDIRPVADAGVAVGELYQAHALGLTRLAFLMLGDRHAAEDVVQDAFCGLYRVWSRLPDHDNVLGYLRVSVLNGCRGHHPGHAEAVEVTFDPERTCYRDVLEFFLQIHRADLAQEIVGSDYAPRSSIPAASSAGSPRTRSPRPTPQACGLARS